MLEAAGHNLEEIGAELKLRISKLLIEARSDWKDCVIRFKPVYPEPDSLDFGQNSGKQYILLRIHYRADMAYADQVLGYIRDAVHKFRKQSTFKERIKIVCIKHTSPSEVKHHESDFQS